MVATVAADVATFRIEADPGHRFGPSAFDTMIGTYTQVQVPVRTGHCEIATVPASVRIVDVQVDQDGGGATVTAEPVY